MLKRVRAAALCVGLASMCVLGTSSPSLAGIEDLGKRPSGDDVGSGAEMSAAATSSLDLVAVTGTNRRLYVRFTDETRWRDLGGQLKDAPAIALSETDAYFVGVGTDDNVWVRTFDLPWRRLGPVGSKCSGASARTSHDVFAVACRGANGKMYVGKVAFVDGSLPPVVRWLDYGGQLKHGVTIADIGDETTPGFAFGAVGVNNFAYVKEDGDPKWYQWPRGLTCSETLEYSEYLESYACRAIDNDGLVYSHASGNHEAFMPGRIIGRPGVAYDPDRTSRFYVVGTDNSISFVTQLPTGYVDDHFTRISGSALYGVVAVSLTPVPPA